MKLFLLFLLLIFQRTISLLEAFLKPLNSNDHLHLSLQYNIKASESIIKLWPDFIHSRNSLFIECFLFGIAFKAIFLRVWSDSHDNYDTLEHESNMTKMRYVCRRSKFYSNLYSISCKLLPSLFLKKVNTAYRWENSFIVISKFNIEYI